eukprot:TRINITY_DN31714_c4_g1_i1.p1 TRINITY_DN31714_c4_g1~~TRINITY_DN31714_c4_g1_i1.p1  ORF type:complete len:437 (+),score=68.67 TRINITY_DN31714_c4_g1_i1:38-1348(+)
MAVLEKATDWGRSATRSISEKWATMSTPSAMRRARSVISGTARMHNDPLEEQRAELVDFDGLISTLSACANTLSCAMDMMAMAPKPMFDPLNRFYSADVPCCQAIARLCTQLDTFASRAKDNERLIENLQDKLRSMSERNGAAHKSFQARDTMWSNQDHYTKKLDALRDQIGKSGSSPKLAEKMQRNEEKKAQSQQEFAMATAETGRVVGDALANRWQDIGEALSKLCQYYVAMFQMTSYLLPELRSVADELVAPVMSQALFQRGQEVASQAKERASNIANDMHARIGAAAASAAPYTGYSGSSCYGASPDTLFRAPMGGKPCFQAPTAQPQKSPKSPSSRKTRTPRSSSSQEAFGSFGGFEANTSSVASGCSSGFQSWPSQGSNVWPPTPQQAAGGPSPWQASPVPQAGGYPDAAAAASPWHITGSQATRRSPWG